MYDFEPQIKTTVMKKMDVVHSKIMPLGRVG